MTPDEEGEQGGSFYDAPNQQVVREDQSGPWEEGEGGEPGEQTVEPPAVEQQTTQQTGTADLDAMTKDELLAYAQSHGISPANAGMTKDDIRASIDMAEGR